MNVCASSSKRGKLVSLLHTPSTSSQKRSGSLRHSWSLGRSGSHLKPEMSAAVKCSQCLRGSAVSNANARAKSALSVLAFFTSLWFRVMRSSRNCKSSSISASAREAACIVNAGVMYFSHSAGAACTASAGATSLTAFVCWMFSTTGFCAQILCATHQPNANEGRCEAKR